MRSQHQPPESLLALARAEPERTKLLLQIGGSGVVALAAWSWIGAMVFGDLLFIPLTLVVLAAYSAGLVVLTGDLVRQADHWQVESAMQARRLMSSGPPTPLAKGSAAAGQPLNPGSFDRWYFTLRLEDMIKEARRHGSQVSIVIMKVTAPGADYSQTVSEQISFDVATIAANYARTMTMPSAISAQEYAFLFPEADREEAKARIVPLLNPLGGYWCQFGIAVYPDDGTDGETLMTVARGQIEQEMERAS